MSNGISIKRGVRLGVCALSYTYYFVLQETLSEETAKIRLNSGLINSIRFADDTLVIAQSSANLHKMMIYT